MLVLRLYGIQTNNKNYIISDCFQIPYFPKKDFSLFIVVKSIFKFETFFWQYKFYFLEYIKPFLWKYFCILLLQNCKSSISFVFYICEQQFYVIFDLNILSSFIILIKELNRINQNFLQND